MSMLSSTPKRDQLVREAEAHVVKHQLKNGYEQFSEKTSMHGFTELYTAKSSAWKIAWILIIGTAIGITIYQVIEAIDQFVNQTTKTVIETAKDDVYYPLLVLYLTHWIDWVDTERMRHYGFSKEAVLYGLSFLTTVYCNKSFDVQMAIRNFTEGMRINNLDTVTEFYEKIAHPIDDIVYIKHAAYFDSDSSVEIFIKASEVFKDNGTIFSDNKNYFCYQADGKDIIDLLKRLKQRGKVNSTANSVEQTRNILEFDLSDELNSRMQLTPEEYNSYMAEWITTTMPEYGTNEDPFTMYACYNPYSCATLDYSAVKPSKMLYVDGFSEIGINISPETDKYFVGVKGSAHYWKSTSKNPCIPHEIFIVSNSTCPKMCKARATKAYPVSLANNEGCLSLRDPSVVLSELDQPLKLCQNKLYILTKPEPYVESWILKAVSSTSQAGTQMTTVFNQSVFEETMHNLVGTINQKNKSDTSWLKVNFTMSQQRGASDMRQSCVDTECNSGCNKWSYDISIRTKSMFSTVRTVATKTYTGIQVEYPLDGDILIMREVDGQTWEDFVGSVGGLLGIWTGASILSFIQLVYLCCCSESPAGGELVNVVTKSHPRVKTPKPINKSPVERF